MNGKRCNDTGKPHEEHVAKRFKKDDQQLTESKSVTTLLDVVDDCLVKIFMYLDLKDLLSIAATNSEFKLSTERAFIQKHLRKPVHVSNGETDNNGSMLKYSVKILQQFGHCITNLSIAFKLENIERLLGPIVEYSGDSIIEMKFHHVKEKWYMGLHRTGLRRMKRQLLNLKAKFPNLRHLKFQYDDSEDCPYSDEIIQAIPTLASFSFAGAIFSEEDVLQFIALNGQLNHLGLWVHNGFVDQTFIHNLDVSLPELQSLKINDVTIEGALDPIHPNRFKNLRNLLFGGVSSSFPGNGLSVLFGKEIEELKLSFRDYIMENLAEIIIPFQKLTYLTLVLPYVVPVQYFDTFDKCILSPKSVKELILRNKQLTKIAVAWCYPTSHFSFFRNKYKDEILNGHKWHVAVRQWWPHRGRGIEYMSILYYREKVY